ncbi:hypothetical protein Igag_1598 [Ignisphaera aggregans DSM 17230]|uniref:Uncharacterized protein n=1 Tax=Ignisphaera aggregans (strain DSM 17230 / JCM 13409 / AQ1.S1) TaxID=583356 RepID=E0SRE6_IGNAA|nr:hypothetical protein Igag_1598 [Ignisphaera aggregans DSM 17230]
MKNNTSLSMRGVMGFATILVIVIGILSAITLPITLYVKTVAEETSTTTTTTNTENRGVLVAQLMLIRNMLSRMLNINISTELRQAIENFLTKTQNVSASLPVDQLKAYIDEGHNLLGQVASEIRNMYSYRHEVEERYVQQLRLMLENRIRQCARLYNVSEEYIDKILMNMSSAKNVKDFAKALAEMNKIVAMYRYRAFGDKLVEINIKGIERNVKGLDKAYKELSKAEEILNKTIEKLRDVNVSQVAVENLEEAIEKISLAKELIRNTTKVIEEEGIDIKKALNKSLEKLASRVNDTIEELREELKEMLDNAIKINDTRLMEDITQLLQKLDNLSRMIVTNNVSIYQALSILAKIKVEAKAIEKMLEFSVRVMPAVDKAYSVALERAEKLLNETKEMVEFIENKSIVCIQTVSPPPPIVCRYNITMVLEKARKDIEIAEKLIENATKLYEEGKKVEALLTLNRANAILSMVRAQLMPIYMLLKMSEHREIKVPTITPPKPGNITSGKDIEKRLEDLEKRLNETIEKLNNLSNKLQRTGERSKALMYIVSGLRIKVAEVQKLIENSKRYLSMGNEDLALIGIANAESLLSSIEETLNNIEES